MTEIRAEASAVAWPSLISCDSFHQTPSSPLLPGARLWQLWQTVIHTANFINLTWRHCLASDTARKGSSSFWSIWTKSEILRDASFSPLTSKTDLTEKYISWPVRGFHSSDNPVIVILERFYIWGTVVTRKASTNALGSSDFSAVDSVPFSEWIFLHNWRDPPCPMLLGVVTSKTNSLAAVITVSVSHRVKTDFRLRTFLIKMLCFTAAYVFVVGELSLIYLFNVTKYSF